MSASTPWWSQPDEVIWTLTQDKAIHASKDGTYVFTLRGQRYRIDVIVAVSGWRQQVLNKYLKR